MFARQALRAATHFHFKPPPATFALNCHLTSLSIMPASTLDIVIPPPPRAPFLLARSMSSFEDGRKIPPRMSPTPHQSPSFSVDGAERSLLHQRHEELTPSTSNPVSIPASIPYNAHSSHPRPTKLDIRIQPTCKLKHLCIDSSLYDLPTRQRARPFPPSPRPCITFPSSYEPTQSLAGTRADLPPPTSTAASSPPILNIRDWRIRLNHLRHALARAQLLTTRTKRRRINRQHPGPWTGPTLPASTPHVQSLPHLRSALSAHLALLCNDPTPPNAPGTISTHLLLPHDHSALMHAYFLLGHHRVVLDLFHTHHPAPDVHAFNLAVQATVHVHGHVAAVRLFSEWMTHADPPDGLAGESPGTGKGQHGWLDAVSVTSVMRVLEALGSLDEAVRVYSFACAKGLDEGMAGQTEPPGHTHARHKVARPPHVVPDAFLRQYAAALQERVDRSKSPPEMERLPLTAQTSE